MTRAVDLAQNIALLNKMVLNNVAGVKQGGVLVALHLKSCMQKEQISMLLH